MNLLLKIIKSIANWYKPSLPKHEKAAINESSKKEFISKNPIDYITHKEFSTINDHLTSDQDSIENVIFNSIYRLPGKNHPQFIINLIDQISLPKDKAARYLFIKADMFHLQGKYSEAIHILKNILDEEHDSSPLTYRAKLRIIHCYMFFENLYKLDSKLKEFNHGKLDNPRYLYEYFYLVGGHIKILQGDLITGRKLLLDCFGHAKSAGNPILLVQTLRKYGNIVSNQQHYSIAIKIYDSALKIASQQMLHRFEIYLLCSKADALRMCGEVAESFNNVELALEYSLHQGIKTWEANCYLVLSNLYFYYHQNSIKANDYYLKAKKIYKEINHQWGVLHSDFLFCIYHYESNKIIEQDVLNSLIETSDFMGYQLEHSLFKSFQDKPSTVQYPYLFL